MSNPASSPASSPTSGPVEQEIRDEITRHKIVIYGKGTRQMPMCGYTIETIRFFEKYGYPFEVINALANPQKREKLSQMTQWPTLPKVFIGGEFYADTDVLDEMEAKGEVKPLLEKVFGGPPPAR